MIHGLIDALQQELGWKKVSIVASGGGLENLRPFLRKEVQIDPDLTLKGLFYLHQNLKKGKSNV
jgi:pantothenate kinase type III